MFTSPNASREKALKASAAAERAMKRHECCKSQFKFMCFSCGEMINRGDKITKCTAPCWDGMRLRFRGADARNGVTGEETAFYLAETGTRTWVHVGCNPCYWDSPPEDSNEYSPPALRPVHTDWNSMVWLEFQDWCESLPPYVFRSFPLFCQLKGYPKDMNWMRDRIIRNVTRFQALWRGYIYKIAYPEALLQAQEEQEDAAAQNRRSRNGFLYNNSIGAHMEVLMDEKRTSAAIYSAEVIKIQGLPEIGGLYYWVKYHHDSEVRRYHWKRLLNLKLECENFKSKHGILAKILGTLPVAVYSPSRL